MKMCLACVDPGVKARLDRQYFKYIQQLITVRTKSWRLFDGLLLTGDISEACDDDCFDWSAWLHDVATMAAMNCLEQKQSELLRKFDEVRTAQLRSTCSEFWTANR